MTEGSASRGRRISVVLAVLVVAVAGVLMVVAWLPSGKPEDGGPEAGFARDMSVHHAQAVEMSFLIRDRTDDEKVRLLAYDIINTQRAQIGMMTAWLDEWELPQTNPAGPMRWMDGDNGHSGHTASNNAGPRVMPGMASTADLDRLKELSGRQAEVLFLQLMIRHHRGGVDMAEAVLDRTEHPRVRRLAQTIVNGQKAEISLMNTMLGDRGSRPA